MPGSSKSTTMRRCNVLYLVLAAACSLVGLWILYGRGLLSGELGLVSTGGVVVDVAPVTVTVYYEVLCPDSKSFIRTQLFPTWDRLQDYVRIDFKPFGKGHHNVKPNGSHEFECQHGPVECQGNVVHNCAVKYVPEPLEYVACMMDEIFAVGNAEAVGEECAKRLELDWPTVRKCYEGPEGKQLMAAVADETLALNPPVSFIPTVLLNGSRDNQDLILSNLLLAVCRKLKDLPLPVACS